MIKIIAFIFIVCLAVVPVSDARWWAMHGTYEVSCVAGNDSSVKLLIQSETTDGSTTFTDSSVVNHTANITVVGATHHETDQHKWGKSSIAFDGTADYIQLADSEDWNMEEGEWTIDAWVNFSQLKATTLFNAATNKTLEIPAGPAIGFYFNGKTYINYTHGMTTGNWYYIRLERSGNNINYYQSGVSVASKDCTGDSFDWSFVDNFYIGGYSNNTASLNGYMEEVRVSKGIARGSGQPTGPFCD